MGWFWHQAPIETQSLLIEAFQEIDAKTHKTVDDLKTWLLKNKQTNNWKTTKATAEACYALLLQGTEWLSNEPAVEIKLGNGLTPNLLRGRRDRTPEAGTGYFKKTIDGNKIDPEDGKHICQASTLKPLHIARNSSLRAGALYTGNILKTSIKSPMRPHHYN